MTYVDQFGFERHSGHCGCPNCAPPCTHTWHEGEHTCNRVGPHTSYHVCECGANTRVRTPRPEGECWWDPNFQKRKKGKTA